MRKRTWAATALLVLVATSANAMTLTANYSFSQIEGVTVTLPSSSPQNVNTANILGVKTGGTENVIAYPAGFRAFCVEIGQTISGGSQSHQNVEILAAGSQTLPTSNMIVFSALQVTQLGRIWNKYVPPSASSPLVSKDDNTAFQLAVWQITYGPGFSYSGVSGAVTTKVNNILATANDANQAVTTLALLSDRDRQDLITEAVPEPFTMIIGAAGLATAIAKRRRAKRA